MSQFGVIGSSRANTILLEKTSNRPKSGSDQNAHYAATAAVENVIIWDIRKGEQVMF